MYTFFFNSSNKIKIIQSLPYGTVPYYPNTVPVLFSKNIYYVRTVVIKTVQTLFLTHWRNVITYPRAYVGNGSYHQKIILYRTNVRT